MNLSKLKTKEFWFKEFKSISLSDILIWIAIILMFTASWQNISAGKDPCSYCIIKNDPIHGDINCKEYFNKNVNLSILDQQTKEMTYGNIPTSDY